MADTARVKTTNFDAVLASSPRDRTAAVVTGGKRGHVPDHRLADLTLAMKALDGELRQARLNGTPRAALAERRIALQEQMTDLHRALGIPTKAERKKWNREMAPQFERAFVEEAKARLPKYLFDELVAVTKRRLSELANAPEPSDA